MSRHLIPFALVCGLACTGVASAQTNVEVNAGLQLNLSQPGARSLGMGGAFIGLADDATAAYTNPAGLANLSTMEIALEGRAWDFTTNFTDGGFAVFRGGEVDTSRLIESESESSTEGYSFGSFVWPLGRWVLAIYRHQLANFETSVTTAGASGVGDFTFSLRPVVGSNSLEIVGTGVAAAYRISDSFSLGIGAINYEMTWESRTRRFSSVNPPSTGLWNNQQEIEGDDEAVSASLGFEWKLAERWRLGGVYRRGAEFDFRATSGFGPGSAFDGLIVDEVTGQFKVPDVYGLGIAYKAASFRLLLDWVRVEYSRLTEDTVNVFESSSDLAVTAARLTLDDADELHVGFEYVFVNLRNPVAVRLGGWLDPDHEVRYQGPVDSSAAAFESVLFRAGDDEIHYTGGLGISLGGGRFEVNAAVDVSERVDTASLSLVWRIF